MDNTTPYKFNPEEYGFEPIENFPELLRADWYGPNTYIKIIENGGESFSRKVYWYQACNLRKSSMLLSDERVSFYSHSYDTGRSDSDNFCLGTKPRQNYFGLVSSHEFAVLLLKNLFGTTMNDSVETHGKERLERNINQEAKE